MPEVSASIAVQIIKRDDTGDILIFMPVKFEIEQTIEAIRRAGIGEDVDVLPLYAELPPDIQRKVHGRQKLKIVAATNIVETSVRLILQILPRKKNFICM